MARGAAKKNLSMDDFKKSMDGIWSSCVNENTIDESPMAYKNKDEVLALIADTVQSQVTLKPIYNFKATESRRR
jgi:RNA-splicing ligase RtcB